MQPLAIDGCFGWLHSPEGGIVSDTAVLICPGLGRDTRTGHRSLRLLANEFASAGFNTLRFDYPGVGDSVDQDGTEQWTACLRSIDRAIDWLRAQTGAGRVMLCGLRIGATLAALVASKRSDVAGLLMLAPIVRGALYIRQHRMEVRLRVASTETTDGSLELDELRMSSQCVRMISDTDLRQLRLPNGFQVAVFAPEARSLNECLQIWTNQGVKIYEEDFRALSALLRDTHLDEEKPADFSAARAWLLRATASFGARSVSSSPSPQPVALKPSGCIEVPMQFGEGQNLFGILCRPADVVESDLVVVICNSGGEPHYGFARFAVQLARGLAESGVASLRFDFAGLGDSVLSGDNGEVTSHVFNVDRQADIAAALDALERLGYRRFAMQGLCSGAYHAFHAGLRNSRIDALILVNLPVFVAQRSDTIIARSLSYYVTALAQKEFWTKLAQGQADPLRIISGLMARLRHRAAAAFMRTAQRMGLVKLMSFPNRSLLTMSKRGVRTLFVFSDHDPGLEHFRLYFGLHAEELATTPGTSLRIEPMLDHELSTYNMRHLVTSITLTFLKDVLSSAAMTAGRYELAPEQEPYLTLDQAVDMMGQAG
jgi:pimeloyl-ACP methyl ester carboxylesterase